MKRSADVFIIAGDVMAYIIPRGDGTVICGGTYDKTNKDLNADPAIAKGILERCYDLCPEVAYNKGVEGYKIISHNVGFRPGRHGGIRLERETRGMVSCNCERIRIAL